MTSERWNGIPTELFLTQKRFLKNLNNFGSFKKLGHSHLELSSYFQVYTIQYMSIGKFNLNKMIHYHYELEGGNIKNYDFERNSFLTRFVLTVPAEKIHENIDERFLNVVINWTKVTVLIR